ncbi:MAG: MFS transporter [Candidatus Helarchaeota archaeon]|nr:MFS transporter [Candidatus Helarchaeota archaeon]
MERSELIKLSMGSIGMTLSYNVLTMNLQDYFRKTAFSGSPDPWLLAYLVFTIAFGAGALTFLFAGWLSDRTYTRWGKRRPYFLFAIPGAIALFLLGFNYVPLPVASAFILLSCLAMVYTITYRLMYTSYFALYQDLTKPEDRVKATITFNLFGLVGIVVAIVIPLAENSNTNYIFVTLICGVVYIATVIFALVFGPREKLEEIQKERAQKIENPSILSSIHETFKDKTFKNYAFSSFFAAFSYSMVMFILKPFLEWKTELRPNPIPIPFFILLGSLLPVALLIFYFCSYGAKRWGKRTFFGRTLMVGFLTFPILIFLSNQGSDISLIIQLYIVSIAILFVIVTVLSLQNAILMDITPKGKEATYSGVFFFVTVLPFPLSATLAGVFLSVFDYDVAGFWRGVPTEGGDFAYGLIALIMAISLFISWLFLRRVKYEEVKER